MLKYAFIIIGSVLITSALLMSCEKDDSHETMFNLRMTDNLLDNAQQVNIDLKSIIVTTDEGRDSFELGTNSGVYNLLDYQGDLDTLIGSVLLDAQSINQIRLILGENNSIMVDSILFDLKTPSGQQSGLKINIHSDLSGVNVYNVLIDFDAEASVAQQGNDNYILKPVIRVVP